MAVLTGLARGERCQRPDGQSEVEADAVEVARTNPGAGQDRQMVFRQQLADFLDDRKDDVDTAIHDGTAADLDDLQPGQQPDRAHAGDRTVSARYREGSGARTARPHA